MVLEGYPPASGPNLFRMSVTPDPGVLEVNLPPIQSTREHAALMDEVFAAALHAGLHSEKYMLDGRQAGSGGGNHITLGGPTTLASPFLVRPDLLASLLVFAQHHPSLSYMFTGLFVGPTSQAPRVDEARLASETLTWLEANGYGDLVRNAVVAINTATHGTSLVKLDEIESHFASRVRDIVRIPYDPQLAAGSVVDYKHLKQTTKDASRTLAALVADGLPTRRDA